MRLDQKKIFVVKALIKAGETETKDGILDKLDDIHHLMKPEVLLTETSKEIYDELVEKARKKGLIA